VLAQLAAPANAGQSSVTLVSAAGISAGQFFGVVQDSGAVFWTTVNGAPAGNNVALVAPLPGGASVQNFSFAYTTKIVRPLKVPFARLLTYQSQTEIPMTLLSRQEYEDLPNKSTPGTPTQFFYTPKLVSGEFYPWPSPANSGWGIRFTWYRPIMDLNTPANTVDFPQEWVNAIGWNLAMEVAPEFDVPPPRWAMIQQMAASKLDLVSSWDRESEPVEFQIDFDNRQR
jgi:hypothetical protein